LAKKKRNRPPAPSSAANPPVQQARRGFLEQYASVLAFLICLISFFVHLYGASFQHRKGMTTVDETVYARLGFQLKNDQPYNTIQLYQETLRSGQKLPDYFKDPLFKHPPFYPFLISLSYALLEKKENYTLEELYTKSSLVSNVMGCLLVWVCFLMGRRLYDYRVGLAAAFMLAIEMNLLSTSMKAWMDSTLAAMFWLSLYLFHKGIDKKWFLVLGGIAAGCALLTKYPAVLLIAIILSYFLLCERHVFKSYHLYLGFLMTGIILLPWVMMNLDIYGSETLTSGQFRGWSLGVFMKFLILCALALGVFTVAIIIKWKNPALYQKLKVHQPKIGFLMSAILLLFVGFLLSRGDFRESLLTSFTWYGFPWAGWEMYHFNYEPRYFYFKHILEYSPFYVFFLAALVRAPMGSKADRFLLLASLWTLIFTSLYGSYQGRYIIYFTPAGLLLAAAMIFTIIDALLKQQKFLRVGATIFFCLVLAYFTAKTIQVSFYQAINNNAAYY